MIILGIETSCDETAAAIVQTDNNQPFVTVLSSTLATSLALHAQTGGIIPEIAAREQIKVVIPVIKECMQKANKKPQDIDAIAVTYGPGLIGSLLVGVETAKILAFVWNKPLIPVNHLFGHIYANWIDQTSLRESVNDEANSSKVTVRNNKGIASQKDGVARNDIPTFPAISLIVSGNHTDIIVMKGHNDILWLGGTRDDAAGEAFDKIGRSLHFSYPAGPAFEKSAAKGNPKRFHFPRPLKHDQQYDFSFSGLKTAAIREIQKIQHLDDPTISDLARCVQDAIIDVLVFKTIRAAQEYQARSIVLGGGVAANQALKTALEQHMIVNMPGVKLFVPDKQLCTDNAAMIATAAHFMGKEIPWQEITADPELYFD